MYASKAIQAHPQDYDRVIASLVAAFIVDPFVRWMFPDPKQYFDYFPRFLKHFGGGAFEHSSAYRSSDFKGAALWLPPGIGPDVETLGPIMQESMTPEILEEGSAVMEQVEIYHPEEAHWYLPIIGVDPHSQRKGYGSALLARSLEICDREHVATYLESTNPENIPLYQRFGFEILGQAQVGSSPVMTPMFRAAR